MTIALDRGADEGPTHLLMFLQLCCSLVEQHLLKLFLLLEVKQGQLRGEVMAHHLKVVLCVSTVLARLGRGDEINHLTVITAAFRIRSVVLRDTGGFSALDLACPLCFNLTSIM